MSRRGLRILFTAYRGNMHCGGQGVYLWFLARSLARLGHRVEVLVGPPYPDPMPFADRVEQVENLEFWAGWFARDVARRVAGRGPAVLGPLHFYELTASRLGFLPEPFAFSVRAFRAAVRRLREGARFDLVHDVQSLGWGLLGIRALGLPVVSTVHHPLTVDREASFARDRSLRDAVGTVQFYPLGMQRAVARRLDAVLTSSPASASRLERDFRIPRSRLHMVWNGIDTELFCPDPAADRVPGQILCVGRASDPNKGIPILVEALARVPPPARLVLVDSDHPDSPARRRARELGVEDRIAFTGRVPIRTLVELYRRSRVVVVPSLYEGFGLPAVEALACGTPVVATRAGALPDVLEAVGGGLLVPPGRPEPLARALAELLERPAQAEELGRRARKEVAARFSWDRIAAATEEVYRAVLDRGRPARMTTSA